MKRVLFLTLAIVLPCFLTTLTLSATTLSASTENSASTNDDKSSDTLPMPAGPFKSHITPESMQLQPAPHGLHENTPCPAPQMHKKHMMSESSLPTPAPNNQPWLHRPPPGYYQHPHQRAPMPQRLLTPPPPPPVAQPCIPDENSVSLQVLATKDKDIQRLLSEISKLSMDRENQKAATILTEASMSALRAERDSLKGQAKKLHSELNNTKQQLSQDITTRKNTISQLQQLENTILSKDQDISKKLNTIEALNKKIQNLQNFQAAGAKKDNTIKSLKEDYTKLLGNNESLTGRLQQSQTKNKALDKALAEKTTLVAKLKNNLQQSLSASSKKDNSFELAKDNYTRIREENKTLTTQLQQIQTKRGDALKQANDSIIEKDKTITDKTNLVAALNKKLKSMEQEQLDNAQYDNIIMSLKQGHASLLGNNKSLTNSLLQTQTKNEMDLKQASSTIQAKERIITEQTNTISELKLKLNNLEENLANAAKNDSSFQLLKKDNGSLQEEIIRLNSNLQNIRTESETALKQANDTIIEKDKASTEKTSIIAELNKKLQNLEQVQSEAAQKDSTIQLLQKDYDLLQGKVASLTTDLESTRRESETALKQAHDDTLSKETAITEKDHTIAELNKELQKLQQVQAAGVQQESILKSLKTKHASLQKNNSSLTANLQQTQAKNETALKQAHENLLAKEKEIAEKTNVITDNSKRINTLNAKLANLETNASKQTSSLGSCQQSLHTSESTVSEHIATITGLQQDKITLENLSKDDDKDGVINANDKCPRTASGQAIDATGCEPDLDRDGLTDRLDLCPATPDNSPIDEVGCAQSETITLEGVNFKSGSSEFTPESLAILDHVVGILTKFTQLKLEVAGHTDNIGSPELNRELSGIRALAVKNYLIEKMIDADRLTAAGYGSEQPIDDNSTREGRSLNRRVELRRATK